MESAFADPRRAHEEKLKSILSRNAGTVFGRFHGFPKFSAIREFRRCVPLSTYDDLRPLIDRSAVPLLEEAYRRGLGQTDLDKLDIRGSFIRLAHFKKPSTYRRPLKNVLINYVANRFVYGFLFSRKASSGRSSLVSVLRVL